MTILYILECMARAVFAQVAVGGSLGTLITTGEPVTVKDCGVALLGWLVLFLVIVTVVYAIRYSLQLKKQRAQTAGADKVVNPFVYILECMAFGVWKNRVMASTGKKPKTADTVLSIASWLYLAAMILGVVLICI